MKTNGETSESVRVLEKQYEIRLRQIVKNGLVWGLWREGWATVEISGRRECLLVWSTRSEAESARIAGEIAGEPKSMDLDELLYQVVPDLRVGGLSIGYQPGFMMYCPEIDQTRKKFCLSRPPIWLRKTLGFEWKLLRTSKRKMVSDSFVSLCSEIDVPLLCASPMKLEGFRGISAAKVVKSAVRGIAGNGCAWTVRGELLELDLCGEGRVVFPLWFDKEVMGCAVRDSGRSCVPCEIELSVLLHQLLPELRDAGVLIGLCTTTFEQAVSFDALALADELRKELYDWYGEDWW